MFHVNFSRVFWALYFHMWRHPFSRILHSSVPEPGSQPREVLEFEVVSGATYLAFSTCLACEAAQTAKYGLYMTGSFFEVVNVGLSYLAGPIGCVKGWSSILSASLFGPRLSHPSPDHRWDWSSSVSERAFSTETQGSGLSFPKTRCVGFGPGVLKRSGGKRPEWSLLLQSLLGPWGSSTVGMPVPYS